MQYFNKIVKNSILDKKHYIVLDDGRLETFL